MRAVLSTFCALIFSYVMTSSVPLVAEEPVEVRLHFISKSWQSVLKDVADQTGQQLVMPKAPRGRISRYDREKYSPGKAIQILNHELKSTGFRIMDRGEFLIVLEDQRFRPYYSPHEMKQEAEQSKQSTQEATETPEIAEKSATMRDPAVQQAAFEDTETEEKKEKPEPKKPEKNALAVEPVFLNATTLSRQLYEIYGDYAKLVDQGPLGLPAFEVNLPGDENRQPLSFVIGIDQQSNRLILVAENEEQQEKIVNVLDVLDQSAESRHSQDKKTDEKTEVLFAPREIHEAASEQLPKIIAQVRKAQQQQKDQPSATANEAENQPATPEKMPPREGEADPRNAASPADLNSILDRIRGDVSIEALNELGLLILRGNEDDVDSVMQIVQAIEQLSAGTTPEVHLRYLDQVNSESLSELLNNVYESVQSTDQRASQQNRPINVIPVVQPNAVIIVCPSIDLESVLTLIDELDQPVNPNLHLQVFHLESATATEAVTVVEEFYADRPGLGTTLRVNADTRTNTLIVQADPKDLKEIRTLVKKLDQDSHAVSRVRIFPLKNAVAEELAEFINTAIDEAINPRTGAGGQLGGQQQQNQQSKSFVLEFLAGSGTQAELIRSGVLSDIRVAAEARTNSLSVIAPQRSMHLIAELIAALDQPADAEAEVKVFTLTHADANAALALLQELFNETNTESPVGVNLAGTGDAGSSLLPLRFSADVRTNSILAIGGSDALTVVEAILLRLDNEAPRKRINQVVEMENVPAADAADAINLFLESQRELSTIDPELVSSYELVEREVIVVPEPLSNNLLISATPEYFAEIMSLVEQLDSDPAQVIIQAMLVEVELDNVDEFGVELGFQDSVLFDRSVLSDVQTITNTVTNQNIQTTTQEVISQEGSPGFLFNNPTLFPNLGNNTSPAGNPSAVGGQGLSNFAVGRVNGDLGFGGLVLSASSESVSVLIRALAQQREVQILSRPQIRTVDSQLAQIQVGQEVPIINGVNITNNGVANPNIEYDQSGIILEVTPRVKPDGQIVMEVVAERSAYQDDGVDIFVDATTGNTITSPIKNISVARATVGVGDGQTIVLGGMITKSQNKLIRKVPWLGDLPIIGRAFRYDSESNARTELLIFLTPRIIHGDKTNEMIKEVEAGRIHFFRDEFEQLHGPIFGVPDPHAHGHPTMPRNEPPHRQDDPSPEQTEPEEAPLPLSSAREESIQRDDEAESNVPRTLVSPGELQPMSMRQQQRSPSRASASRKGESDIPWKKYSLWSKDEDEQESGRVRLSN